MRAAGPSYGGRKARSARGGRIVCSRANSWPSRSASAGRPASSAGSRVIGRPAALPATRRITKNGRPSTALSAQAKSGSGTVTPAAKAARSTANSSTRPRLDGTPVAASVRSTRRCEPARMPPSKLASMPQFSWIAPPASNPIRAISTAAAPLASRRKSPSARCRSASPVSDRGNAVAAIDRDARAGDVGAGGRAQKQERPAEIRDLPDPLHRHPRRQLQSGLALKEIAVEIGHHVAGRYRVDEDVIPRQLHRHRAVEVQHTCFRSKIGGDSCDRAEAQHRGNVDDAPAPLLPNEVMGELARHQPGALEVGVDDVVPIFLGVLEKRLRHHDPGIVDQHRQPPERGFDSAERGGTCLPVVCDITSQTSIAAALGAVETTFGRLSVLVNNAGVVVSKPFFEHTEEDWDHVVDTNLKGAWLMAREFAHHLVGKKRGGRIVNIASVLSFRTIARVPSYLAAKAGVLHLNGAMAMELARYDILVNAIAPGYVVTDFNRDFLESEAGLKLAARVPMKRVGQVADLGGALLFLCSPASAYITGACISVDGGHGVAAI